MKPPLLWSMLSKSFHPSELPHGTQTHNPRQEFTRAGLLPPYHLLPPEHLGSFHHLSALVSSCFFPEASSQGMQILTVYSYRHFKPVLTVLYSTRFIHRQQPEHYRSKWHQTPCTGQLTHIYLSAHLLPSSSGSITSWQLGPVTPELSIHTPKRHLQLASLAGINSNPQF